MLKCMYMPDLLISRFEEGGGRFFMCNTKQKFEGINICTGEEREVWMFDFVIRAKLFTKQSIVTIAVGPDVRILC